MIWLLAAGVVLALDQQSKRLVIRRAGPGCGSDAWWAPRIRPLRNSRLGHGLLGSRRMLCILWVVSLLGIAVLVDQLAALRAPAAQLGIGAALGGAASNLMDIALRGAVVDFIDLRIWPVFNLADLAIVLGGGATLWRLAMFVTPS